MIRHNSCNNRIHDSDLTRLTNSADNLLAKYSIVTGFLIKHPKPTLGHWIPSSIFHEIRYIHRPTNT
jgi:hypothetical protein